MERTKCWKKKVLDLCGRSSSDRRSRLGHWLVVIAGCACAVGCTTLKKAGIVGLAGGTGALVGGLASPAILAPVAGAAVTSAIADVATGITPKGKNIMNESCAPDNVWSAIGDLISISGYGIILIIIIPMIFSWLLPGPVKFKSKKD